MVPAPFFQLVRLDLLMKWSLYAVLPVQMCSCTFFIVPSVVNCPGVKKMESTPSITYIARMLNLYLPWLYIVFSKIGLIFSMTSIGSTSFV